MPTAINWVELNMFLYFFMACLYHNKNTLLAQSAYAWLPFVETMRTEYLNYSPHKLKEIRDLVDTYEAGEIELTE